MCLACWCTAGECGVTQSKLISGKPPKTRLPRSNLPTKRKLADTASVASFSLQSAVTQVMINFVI